MSIASVCSPPSLLPSVYLSILFFLPFSYLSCRSLHHAVCQPLLLSLSAFISFHLLHCSLPPFLFSIRLPSCIPNLPIVSLLPLWVSSLVITPLLSPPLLTGTILHSAPGSASLRYFVCVCCICPLPQHSHTDAHTYYSGWYTVILLPIRGAQGWIELHFKTNLSKVHRHMTHRHTSRRNINATHTHHSICLLLAAGPLSESSTSVKVRIWTEGVGGAMWESKGSTVFVRIEGADISSAIMSLKMNYARLQMKRDMHIKAKFPTAEINDRRFTADSHSPQRMNRVTFSCLPANCQHFRNTRFLKCPKQNVPFKI